MKALLASLAQDHRDALVAYYLGQIVPNHTLPAGRGLVTEQDLYEFLLIDNQVNAGVDTSRIAMGMASVQQYLHAIFNGMEPGYQGIVDGHDQQQWRTAKSEYAIWAANQMLQDYPENYLEPGLRLNQTQAFNAFINDTNQSRISTDTVQRALQHYLDTFERISNLRVVSGYIDGQDFRHADYYFVGRQNVEPHAWFWRKAALRFGDAGQTREEGDDYLSPTAWSEWSPIDIPKGNPVLHIRPVLIDGRLYVAWVEHRTEQRPSGSRRAAVPPLYEETSRFDLHLSYRSLEGSWSVPMRYALTLDDAPDDAGDFVAYVSESDPDDKKIVLAFAARAGGGYERLILDARFNVLFQGREAQTPDDPYLTRLLAGILHFVEHPQSLQHPLAADQPAIVDAVNDPDGEHVEERTFNGTLSLEARLGIAEDGRYRVRLEGHCSLIADAETLLEMTLYLKGGPEKHTKAVTLNGDARTTARYLTFADWDELPVVTFGLAEPLYRAINQYDLVPRLDLPVPPSIVHHDGGQFLDLASLGLTNLRYVRLNTLFARELVARATQSVEALLSWDTQHIHEPAPPASGGREEEPDEEPPLMDFHGANGRYFWELFFHIPHAIAWRLHHEFDYLAAEQWLHYLFNPQARIKPTTPPSPFYWSVRPLEEPGRGEYEVEGITDPDALCYSRPVHYRKAIFTFYVRNLMAYGDMLYRRLTRDALNEAKLIYVRALSLLGPRPDNRMVGRWQPVSLAEAAAPDPDRAGSFTAPLPQTPLAPPINARPPWLELLDSPRFRLPVNSDLLDLWDELDRRLKYLRDNLTLDGKPLLLPLYAPPVDPKDLLRAQNSGSGLVQRSVGSLAPIPPFRFRALLPRLQNAAEILSRFGDQVRQYRELKDRAMQEELQQAHVLELSQFGIQLQDVALEHATLGLQALEASRRLIDKRRDHYETLAREHLSPAEEDAMNKTLAASVLSATAQSLSTSAGAAQMASVIATAVGGGHTRAGAALLAASGAVEIAASALRINADRLTISEQYRRRHQEWVIQRDLAVAELDVIDEQIEAQRSAIEMVQVQQGQAIKAEKQSQDYYRFLKTRSTNADLYQWLLSQLSTFYFQAYDAVVALCLNGEACWHYEMGDYQTRFIQPNVWFDNHFGLTAGEALRLQLLRMESAWLKRYERRLELVKTVSLKALFDGPRYPETNWLTVYEELVEGQDGSLVFSLSPQLFDDDYPGHYLRQLVSVSVSLPALVGPYQDVRAVLTQVASRTVLKADPQAMNALYEQADADPRHILYNPRASQSICLSRGLDDHGVFQLDFNDERYLPFEGTGALSDWELKFPRHSTAEQQVLLQSLTDIIVQVRYTALDGGPEFAAHVEGLLGG